jgi:hypothetical protein
MKFGNGLIRARSIQDRRRLGSRTLAKGTAAPRTKAKIASVTSEPGPAIPSDFQASG